jgi:hypothetical protein
MISRLKTRFMCWRYGHDWDYVETLGPRTVCLGCRRCRTKVAYNPVARLEVPWETVRAWYGPGGILKPAYRGEPVFMATVNPRDPEADIIQRLE